jgi:hypothetical protein
MIKQSKQKKCKLCRNKIRKGNECYYGGSLVCSKCFQRLKTPIPTRRRNSWMIKLVEEIKLRKGI